MKVVQITPGDIEQYPPSVLAIGKFDGVHVGHQAILSVAREHATSGEVAIMSIWPHPAWVLTGLEGYDRSLTPFREKCRLVESFGVQTFYDVNFTREFAAISATDFVSHQLRRLSPLRVVVGDDFTFGHGGKAGVDELRHLCSEIGVPVTVVPPVEQNGVKVSSSQIRSHIEAGRVEVATGLLGRPYTLEGPVIHGDHRGRTLGFPTANLAGLEEYVLPKPGVYVVSVAVESVSEPVPQAWFGVMNAGYRPTVDGTSYRVEVHLFDFSKDVYGERLRVSLLARIRDERRFESLDELKSQIAHDVEHAKSLVGQVQG